MFSIKWSEFHLNSIEIIQKVRDRCRRGGGSC